MPFKIICCSISTLAHAGPGNNQLLLFFISLPEIIFFFQNSGFITYFIVPIKIITISYQVSQLLSLFMKNDRIIKLKCILVRQSLKLQAINFSREHFSNNTGEIFSFPLFPSLKTRYTPALCPLTQITRVAERERGRKGKGENSIIFLFSYKN